MVPCDLSGAHWRGSAGSTSSTPPAALLIHHDPNRVDDKRICRRGASETVCGPRESRDTTDDLDR